jgi:hypothetical protein
VRGWRRQVIHSVLTGVRDQQRRGTVDVFGQHLDGPIRVAGEREFPELPVFPGQVALVIVGEHPVPPAVELGAVRNFVIVAKSKRRAKGLTAGDVQETLDALAGRLSTRSLQITRLCLERAIRHARSGAWSAGT